MSVLTREQILAAQDFKQETVPVPEWGGEVLVRGLTGAQRDEFEASWYTGEGKDRKLNLENLRARLVALSVVNEKGERQFSAKDVKALGEKSALALDRVFDAAQRVSGFTGNDVEKLAGN
jgi:hypothetical protein